MVVEAIQGAASQYLLDLAGLWALLALIPLILVYLIRPRPKKQTIPALMFLMKESAKSDKKSFLRRFIRDPLFLFQILVILAFAVAIAKPYIMTTEDVFVEKTALLVDASASSQVELGGKTRFERAIDIAKDQAGSNNVIIVMSSIPELVADNVELSKARSELEHIKPRDTPTNIFDSIIYAGNYVREKDKVIVISDFIETSSQKDYKAAKNILESKGMIVDLINLRDLEEEKAKNIGIIDVDVTEEETSIQIKNYNDMNESVKLELEGANLTLTELLIEAKSVEVVSFPTPGSLSRFSVRPRTGSDDLPLDNEVFISSPTKEMVPLLYISNKASKHMQTALDVIGMVTVDRGIPPKIPDIQHQIIVIDNIKPDLILPGTMNKIRKQVDSGAALVVIGQTDVLGIDFEGMLPVERADNDGPVLIDHEAWIMSTHDTTITEDINFGRATRYLKVKPKDGATTLASTTNNVSMIVMKNYGKGMVVYFGLLEDDTTFKEDIYFPVFWKRLFDMAIKKQDLSELNFKTGKLINLLEKQKIVTPYGKVNAETIMLSHQGIYRGEERNFIANLADEDESDVNGEEFGQKIGVFDEDVKTREEVEFELVRHFIIGLIVLVFIELLWIKFRGDL